MPDKIIYSCQTCGYYFRSDDDGLRYAEVSRCLACGEAALIPGSTCDKCGGQVKVILQPKCPKCKSSHVQNRGSISAFN